MKIRSLIIWFCAAAILIAVLVIWFSKRPAKPLLQPTLETTAIQGKISAASNSMAVNQSTPTNVVGAIASTNPTTVPPPRQDRVEILKTLLQANDVDIVFYGRLEDQFGNAVGNANVNFSVRHENLSGAGVQRGQVTADGNGFFTISGYRGQDISVVPEKAGYVPLSMEGSGNYSPALYSEDQRAHPNPNNPVVIKMWKLQGAEHLISFNIEKYIPIDEMPVSFDLQTGQQIKSGGDLTVRLESVTTPSVRKEYDWQVVIQMAEGGIIQDSSGLGLQKMFQAPDSGYAPEFDLSFQKGTRQWTSRFNGDFYSTSRGGKCYGKFKLKIITDVIKDGTVPIILNGYLNPAGSRNLEIDPAMVTGAHP